jgi:hypothetical protein
MTHKLAAAIKIPEDDEGILDEVTDWKNWAIFVTALVSGFSLFCTAVLSVRVTVTGTVRQVKSEPVPLHLNWFTVSPGTNKTINYYFEFEPEEFISKGQFILSFLTLAVILFLWI